MILGLVMLCIREIRWYLLIFIFAKSPLNVFVFRRPEKVEKAVKITVISPLRLANPSRIAL